MANKSGNLTDAEIEQRQKAAVKHGVYSKQVTPAKAGRLADLEDQLSTRPGVQQMQIEQTAKAIQMVDAATAYVIKQHQSGKPLDRIPLIKSLPAFMNTAQRALRQLHDLLPDEHLTLTASDVLKDLQEGITEPDDNGGD